MLNRIKCCKSNFHFIVSTKKIVAVILFLFAFVTVKSQETKLIGTWEGSLINGDNVLVWKMRIKILSATNAELHLYNDIKEAYVNYLTDDKFTGTKRTVTFNAIGNYAVMTVLYNSKMISGQSVYNFKLDEASGDVTTIWSNLSNPQQETAAASAILKSDKIKIFSKSNITTGGKSFDNINIEKVEIGDKSTKVSIKVTNNTKVDYNGTFHEPGNSNEFYISDISRAKKYKLTGSNAVLPHPITLKAGESQTVILYFEPLPMGTKTFNVMENGEADNKLLWKFYDVYLND
jgi:hypothetical protein